MSNQLIKKTSKNQFYFQRVLLLTLCLFLASPTLQNKIFQFDLDCQTGQYPNNANFECQACGENQIPDEDTRGCRCSYESARPDPQPLSTYLDCLACPAGNIQNPNTHQCLATPPTGTCVANQSLYQIFKEDGDLLNPPECFSCAANTFEKRVEGFGNVCLPCQANSTETSCTCSGTKLGDECFPQTSIDSVSSGVSIDTGDKLLMQYSDLSGTSLGSGTTTVDSALLHCELNKASVKCDIFSDPIGCSSLANLCAISLYNAESTACKNFLAILAKNDNLSPVSDDFDPNWKESFPLLYYKEESTKILNAENIDLIMRFSGNSSTTVNGTSSLQQSKLPLYLVQYDLAGEIRRFKKLDGELLQCSHSYEDNTVSLLYGIAYKAECNLNLQEYFDGSDETFVYELWIKNGADYIDVPVSVTNLRNADKKRPNSENDGPDGLTLVRRFVLVESASGVKEDPNKQQCSRLREDTAEVITYPSSIKLIVRGQSNNAGAIYRPYLVISYKQKRRVDLLESNIISHEYSSLFSLEMTTFWYVAIFIFIFMTVIGLIVCFVRLYIWNLYYPSTKVHLYPNKTGMLVYQIIYVIFETIGFTWFFFMCITTGYWFIFFKFQQAVYCVLPSPSASLSFYMPFYILFWVTFVMILVSSVMTIRDQSLTDIFFIDWESKRFYSKRMRGFSPVRSIWRCLLIANEYNELTVERYVSFRMLGLLAGFLLISLGGKQLEATQPYLKLKSSNIEDNFVLGFFLNSMIVFGIGCVIYTLRRLLVRFFPSEIQDFEDLCSVANISVIFFDSPFHGYYIHGKNVAGQADGDLNNLMEGYKKEAKGDTEGRGLDPDDQSFLQTFEIFIPVKYREKYNKIMQQFSEVREEDKKFKQLNKKKDKVEKGEVQNPKDPKNPASQLTIDEQQKVKNEMKDAEKQGDYKLEILEGQKEGLNDLFKNFIETARSEKGTSIIDKPASMMFFGYPPVSQIETIEKPIFYKDPMETFKSTSLMGIDVKLLILDAMVFNGFGFVFDLLGQGSNSTPLSLLCFFVFQYWLRWLRNWYGEANIQKKTLIDERFLIQFG